MVELDQIDDPHGFAGMLQSNGLVTVPKDFRERHDLSPGDKIAFCPVMQHLLRYKRLNHRIKTLDDRYRFTVAEYDQQDFNYEPGEVCLFAVYPWEDMLDVIHKKAKEQRIMQKYPDRGYTEDIERGINE